MEKQEALSNQRKKLLINPHFQMSFLAYTIGMAAVVIGVFYGANVFFFWRFMEKGREVGLPEEHVFFKFLAEQAKTMDYIFIATSLFTLIFLVVYGFYLSNRVAGALWRLQSHFEEVIKTETFKPLRFRKKDYFPEVAETVNDFVKHFVPGKKD